MKQTAEVEYCKNLFYISSRSKILSIIEDSNLNDRERSLISARYISGLSVKEICDQFNIEESTYKKIHRRILFKLYIYITVNKLA